jgi:hypothetical protein
MIPCLVIYITPSILVNVAASDDRNLQPTSGRTYTGRGVSRYLSYIIDCSLPLTLIPRNKVGVR